MRVILMYTKYGMKRFLSPLETIKAIERNLRRAKIPMIFSSGYHPMPKISYLDSISTGVVVRELFLSLEVEDWKEEDFSRLKETSLDGLEPRRWWVTDVDINELAVGYDFSLIMDREALATVPCGSTIVRKGKKRKEHRLGDLVENLEVVGLKRFLVLKYTLKRENLFSPWEIVKVVFKKEGLFIPICDKVRAKEGYLKDVLERMMRYGKARDAR